LAAFSSSVNAHFQTVILALKDHIRANIGRWRRQIGIWIGGFLEKKGGLAEVVIFEF
jgi:hypothetical protein